MLDKMREARRVTVAGLAVASAIGVAACGSSSSTTSSSATSSSAATTAATTGSGSSSSSSSVVSAAEAQVAQYTKVPSFTAPGASLDASKLKGKQILVVDNDQVAQELVSINQGVSAAAAAAGLKVSFFNGMDTVSTDQQGIQQGVNQKVGAIILDGVDPSLVPSAVSAAKAAGIPVIAATLGTTLSNPDVFGTSSPNYVLTGQLMADAAVITTGGKVTADVVQFTNPTVPEALQGIKSVFSKCASTCTISKSTTIEPQNWPTQVPSSVVAMVKANPSVNIVFGVIDDTMGNFAATGVRESGSSTVKVIAGQGSGPAPLATVQAGGVYYADPGQSAQWTGWGAVDQAMRGMLKMSAGTDVTPLRYLDASSLKGVNVKDADSIYGTAYITGFKKLWGLS